MSERVLLSSVGIRMFVFLGACVRWKQAEDEMINKTDQTEAIEETVPELTVHFDVTCPWCLSDDTKPVNAVMGIFECCVCGEVFGRPSAG